MSVLFAVLALVSALFCSFMFGFIGLGATVLFALLTFLFAAKKKREGNGGTGSIIVAIISIIISCGLTFMVVGVGNKMVKESDAAGTPMLKEYGDDMKFGVFGVAMALTEDNADYEEFKKQFETFTDYLGKQSGVTSEK